MRKQMLATLLKIDLLSVNPQLTHRIRLRGKKETNLILSLLQQLFFTSLIFMVIYGLTIFPIDFYRFKGLMSYYFLLFNSFALLQGVTSIFHLFFNEQGLKEYIPLPVTIQEIYISKSLIALLNMASYSLPCILLFIDYGWYHQNHLVSVCLLSFLVYLCLLLVNYAIVNLSLLIFSFIPKFADYQKRFAQILMIVMTILVVWSILYVNQLNVYNQIQPIPLIYPILHIFNHPLSFESLYWFSLLLIVTIGSIGLMLWISHLRLTSHQWQFTILGNNKSTKKRFKTTSLTLNKTIYIYHFRLINDYRFLFQVLLASLIVPFIFIWRLDQKLPKNLMNTQYAIIFLIGGLFLSAYTIHPQSFIANLFSLERQNLAIIYQLPLNQKEYIKQKFQFGFIIQLILNSLIYGLFLFRVHLPALNIFSGFIGIVLGTFWYGSYYFSRDYQKPYTMWPDYFQLLNRKANGFKMIFLYGGQLLLQTILLMGVYYMIDSSHFVMINLLVTVILIVSMFIFICYTLKVFRSQISN